MAIWTAPGSAGGGGGGGGGVVIQLESLQQTVRDQQATIKELTRQVDDLMKFKTSMNDFLAYKSEIQRMINGVEKKMADQAAADQKQRAWFQTRLDTHKREIAKLLDSDRNKAERLRIIEEQLAGMDFDMYALSGAGGEQRSDFSEHGLGATSPPEVDQKSM
eukprot:g1773.t1